MEERTTRMTGQEKFYSCNTLVCLLQALKGHTTTVELRNESEVHGTIDNVDGFMNVTVTRARFTDPAGTRASFDSFFVHGRQIRYVHIPDEVSPLSAIRRQLEVSERSSRPEEAEQVRRSRRTKKAQAYTRDTVRAMNRQGPPGQSAGRMGGQPARQMGGQPAGQTSAPPAGRPDDDASFV